MTKLMLLGAGGPAAVAPTSFTDNFNRANENAEASANYTRVDGAAGAAAIVSNTLSHTTSTNSAYYCNDINAADHYAQITVPIAAALSFSVAGRIADSNNFVGARYADTGLAAVELYKRVAGTFTLLGSYSTTLGAPAVLRLEVSGDNARVLVGAVERITWASLGGSLSGNTRAGFIVRSVLTGLDNFEAGTL